MNYIYVTKCKDLEVSTFPDVKISRLKDLTWGISEVYIYIEQIYRIFRMYVGNIWYLYRIGLGYFLRLLMLMNMQGMCNVCEYIEYEEYV